MTRNVRHLLLVSICASALILLSLSLLSAVFPRLECKFFGTQKNNRLFATAEKLCEVRADYKEVREALGEPDENGRWEGRQAWTYRGCHGLSVVLWFDIQAGEVVDIGAVIRSQSSIRLFTRGAGHRQEESTQEVASGGRLRLCHLDVQRREG